MDSGEQITGTRDEQYNLVSALYHALQGADACDTYSLDAEAVGGRAEVIDFFRETQITYAAVSERAKELLGIPEVPPPFGVAPGVAPDEVVPPEDIVVAEDEVLLEDVPPEDVVVMEEEEAVLEDVPPEVPPEDVVIEEEATLTTGVPPGDVMEEEALVEEVPPEEVPPGDLAGEEATIATDLPVGDVVPPEDPEATVRVAPEDFDATISALRGGAANLSIERALAEIDDWQVRLSESGDPELLPVAENLRRLSALLTADEGDARAVGEVLRNLGSQAEHLADTGAAPPEIAGRLKTLGGLLASEGGSIGVGP